MNKPTKNFVTFCRYEGNYDWLHPQDKQIQYVFVWGERKEQAKEKELKNSFLIDPEKDYGFDPERITALDLAYELKNIIDDYWINSDKERINNICNFLGEIEEEEEAKRKSYDIEYAKYMIHFWTEKLEKLTS